MESRIESTVYAILDEKRTDLEAERLTYKQVRRMAEVRLEMPPKSLNAYKALVTDTVQKYANRHAEEESQEPTSPIPQSRKKREKEVTRERKRAKITKETIKTQEKQKKTSVPIKFYKDLEQPKQLKKTQMDAMSGKDFEEA